APEESRTASVTLHPESGQDGLPQVSCERMNLLVEDLKDVGLGGNATAIRNSCVGLETSVGEWLAFNPALALDQGWRRSDGGLFGWEDGDGSIMVESIWWCDGYLGHRSPKVGQVGEGWLVVASPEAFGALFGEGEALQRVERVERSMYEEQVPFKKTSTRVVPWR
ncbi:hypothetical protein ACFL6M_04460, partial [Candidatus Eisenbacteria bacterium]